MTATRAKKAVGLTLGVESSHSLVPLPSRDEIDLVRARHQRLWLLKFLGDVPGYRLNDHLLMQLLEKIGAPMAKAQLHHHLQWLARRGYIQVDESKCGGTVLIVAILKEAGQSVAKGIQYDDGVARPPPDGW